MPWERIDNVRREMVERGMSSLIVSDLMSIYYLSDVYIEPGERMLALLLKPDAVKLYVNALFPVEQQDGLEICVLNDGFEPTTQLSQNVSGIVGVDKNWPSRFLLALMERASIKPVVGSPAVDICRMHKDAWEMEEMRKASAGNDRVMERTIRQLREGMTERELAAIMTKIYDEEGMPRVAFDPLICFGENGAFPHHETGDSKLKPGDGVIIDTGHRWGMYCSDMTRTVFFKSCTDEQRNVYDIVTKATNAQLAEVGMVFSVEPGIYLPGKFGVRIEDLVAMTENGCEVLNHHTHDLIIVD